MKTAMLAAALLGCSSLGGVAQATPCGGDFATWNASFQQEAAGKGISHARSRRSMG